jgi:hypothetical protein
MVSDTNLALQAPTTRTVSGAGPALALGAQCDGRGMAARVIVTALTGTATFSLEHSADGSTWATAGTVVGGAVYAPGEYVILFAAARRDVRLAVALSGGGARVTYQGELAPVRWGEGRERRLVLGADAPPGPAVLFAFDPATDGLDAWTAISPAAPVLGGPVAERADGLLHLVSGTDADANAVQAATFRALAAPGASAATVVSLRCAVGTLAVLPTEGASGATGLLALGIQDPDNPLPHLYDDLLGLYRRPSGAWALFLTNRDYGDYPTSDDFALDPAGTVLELVYDASGPTPTGRLSVDGAPTASVTDTSTGGPDPLVLPNVAYVSAGSVLFVDNFDVTIGAISVADGVQGV